MNVRKNNKKEKKENMRNKYYADYHMNRILVVVDMQNDFIDGTLGTKEAVAIVPKIVKKIQSHTNRDDATYSEYWGNPVVYTMDTHENGYLNTQEGRNLPVEHCIYPSNGWMLNEEIANAIRLTEGLQIHNLTKPKQEFRKNTFGSDCLSSHFKYGLNKIDSIELVGVCTGICVISNAILLKAAMPEVNIIVDASCCACVTPESHKIALEAMKMCQIEIINE